MSRRVPNLVPVLLCALTSLGVAAIGRTAAAQDPQSKTLTIEGSKVYSAAEVLSGLQRNPVAWRNFQQKGDAESLQKLASSCFEAYRRLGYGHARVQGRLTKQGGVLRIQEGEKVCCGNVRIIGADEETAAQMADVLRYGVDSNGGIWKEGNKLPAGPAVRAALQSAMLEAGVVRSLGDYRSELAADNRVDLVMTLTQVRPAIIGKIEVVGNKINSREAILNLLPFEVGSPLSGPALRDGHNALQHSGRFRTQAIHYDAPSGEVEGGFAKVTVEVLEQEQATPLDEPLSEEERVLQRAADWIAEHGDAFVIESPVGLLSCIQGEMFAYVMRDEQGKRQAAAMIDGSGVTLTDFVDREWITTAGPDIAWRFDAKFHCAQEKDRSTRMLFGFHFKSDPPPNASLISIGLQVEPAWLMQMASKASLTKGNDEWLVEHDEMLLAIEPQSGAVRSVRWQLEDAWPVTVRFSAEEAAQQQRSIRDEMSQFKNRTDAKRPLTAVVAWLTRGGFRERMSALCRATDFDKVGQAIDLDTEVMEAIHVLAQHNAFAPLDEVIRDREDEVDKPSFALTMDDVQDGASLTLWLLMVDQLFPEGSWAWSAARASLLTWSNHPHDTAEWLRAVEAPNGGPLAATAAAWVLEAQGQDILATGFRSTAARRLNLPAFQREYAMLLENDHLSGRLLRRTAEAARRWKPRHIQAAARHLPPPLKKLTQDLASGLQAHDIQEPVAKTLPPLLDAWWNAQIQDALRTAGKKNGEISQPKR